MAKLTPREFKTLEDKWYSKLKKSGFSDIEEKDHISLKQWHCSYFQKRYSAHSFQEKQRYYELAGAFLNDHAFCSKKEQQIWKFHCEGKSSRSIAAHYGCHHNGIDLVIKQLAAQMLDQIIVRDAVQTDHSFIYASWIKCLYSDSNYFKPISRHVFTAFYSVLIKKMIMSSKVKVRVSCLADDPDIVLGYSVIEGPRLHWVFIKADWRGKGLGILKSLVPQDVSEATHLTKAGRERLPDAWKFQPYYL